MFEHPKPTIDLDYLYSVRNEIQKYAKYTNSQLKKNVYQNYSLFIDSSREISTLKEEMRQLNTLLEQQQTSMNQLLDQLNKSPIIQPTIEKPEPRNDIFGNLNDTGSNDDDQSELLPQWFVKSPEDFDVHIAQRNLKEAVELVKRIREHFVEYPKCCDNDHTDLKSKIDNRIQELINVISSELQPVTDRSVQGGPRSSISSIQLLRELNLSSKAVKLYLDLRSSVLRFVLDQQKVDKSTTLQHIKQICSIFFHNTIETCNEFKQAFELEKFVNKAIDECDYLPALSSKYNPSSKSKQQLFALVSPIYHSEHPKSDNRTSSFNGNDISSQILSPHTVKVSEDTLMQSQTSSGYRTFYYLSTYASLTYWITLEFENFLLIYREHVFNSRTPLTLSVIAEGIYFLRCQCTKMTAFCGIDMSQTLERDLSNEIRRVIEDSGRKLIETIKKLDQEEKWQPQQFQNKAEKTRFLEEMSDVDLKTMPKYVPEFKLQFTASKTAFARCYLITVSDLAKLVAPLSRNHVDTVLAKAFEIQIESVITELSEAKMTSKARFIMSNSNFLLDKVIVVACEKYAEITGQKCQKLLDLRTKYQAKADSVAKLQNVF